MKRSIITAAALFTMKLASAQDMHFSQFNEAPLLLNPASAGVFDGNMRVSMNYRNQWAAMGSPYKTMGASFDMPLMRDNVKRAYMGAGLSVFQDAAGDAKLGLMQAGLSFSGVLPLDRNNSISGGLLIGFGQRSISGSALQFANQYNSSSGYDPSMPSFESAPSESFTYADIGAGFYYEYSNQRSSIAQNDMFRVNAGLSCFHVNQPVQAFIGNTDRLYRKFVTHASMHYEFPESKIVIAPGLMVAKQGPAREINIGSRLLYRIKTGTKITGFFSESMIGFGAFYRTKDAILPQIYYELGDFALALAYDVNVSSFKEASGMNGGFEIAVKWANMRGALRK
jgi:type IX secretion system PorP/SprF family membrane protein